MSFIFFGRAQLCKIQALHLVLICTHRTDLGNRRYLCFERLGRGYLCLLFGLDQDEGSFRPLCFGLLESAVSYMDMLAADPCNYMGRRAIASLLIKTVGTIVCILCMLGVVFRSWNWPLWIILLAAAAEKFDVEMFKKNEGAYIKSTRYKQVYPVL